MWKSKVISASDRIFPGLAYHDRIKEFHDIGNQIKSSLPLQIALYFNAWVFPFWFLIGINLLDEKFRKVSHFIGQDFETYQSVTAFESNCYFRKVYDKLSDIYKFITVGVFLILSVSEFVRLYLGYLGNLSEKIPELACFWLISTLIQFPLEAFLLFDEKMLPSTLERVINSVMMFFLLVEIATGTVALRTSANHHAKRFYLAQLYEINDKSE